MSIKPILKKITESLVLYIIFCAISESIYTGFDAEITDIVLMAVIMFCIHSATLIIVWYLSGIGMVRNVKNEESIDSMEMRLNARRSPN